MQTLTSGQFEADKKRLEEMADATGVGKAGDNAFPGSRQRWVP